MTASNDGPRAREAFDRLLAELRPKLHRYCARMTGSVIDGEDVVQEALMKAIEALPATGTIANPEGWLFRIAHNAAHYLRVSRFWYVTNENHVARRKRLAQIARDVLFQFGCQGRIAICVPLQHAETN